jgi:hypothetical protein
MRKVGAIIVVAAVAVAAFVVGRMSSGSRSFDSTAFERAYATCVESVALEYRDKIKAEFRQAQQAWEAEHSPLPSPLRAPVYRVYEPPDHEGYMDRVAPTRVDYQAYNERRIECARAAAQR